MPPFQFIGGDFVELAFGKQAGGPGSHPRGCQCPVRDGVTGCVTGGVAYVGLGGARLDQLVEALDRSIAMLPAELSSEVEHWRMLRVAGFFGEACAAAGRPADGDFAHLGRIGGATDIFEVFGPVEGKALLVARGRWGTDIAEIYARVSAELLSLTSARMGDADGTPLEELVPHWTQGR